MQIDYNILITYGGVAKKFAKGEYIYTEGSLPHFYHQIIEGDVKLFSANDNGKEIIQGIFTTGQSFGEPPLLLEKPYISNAIATSPLVVIRITRDKLLNIFKDFPEITTSFLFNFAERLYDKASLVQIRIGTTPEDIIELFLFRYKENLNTNELLLIPYTRQQIADFTSLRVETVIRTLRKMNADGTVKIIDHKLYY